MNSTDRHRVMLVDDEESVLNSLRRTFRGRQYELEAFTLPSEALQCARHWDFDVIVSDYRMPGMDGVTLVKEIKRHRPGIVAIMLSGYTHLGAVLGAINEAEVFRYVTKPWNDDELRSLVAAAIERRRGTNSDQALADAARQAKTFLPVPNGALAKLEAWYPGITNGVWDPEDLRRGKCQ